MYGVKHVIWHSSDQKNIIPYKKNWQRNLNLAWFSYKVFMFHILPYYKWKQRFTAKLRTQ